MQTALLYIDVILLPLDRAYIHVKILRICLPKFFATSYIYLINLMLRDTSVQDKQVT